MNRRALSKQQVCQLCSESTPTWTAEDLPFAEGVPAPLPEPEVLCHMCEGDNIRTIATFRDEDGRPLCSDCAAHESGCPQPIENQKSRAQE